MIAVLLIAGGIAYAGWRNRELKRQAAEASRPIVARPLTAEMLEPEPDVPRIAGAPYFTEVARTSGIDYKQYNGRTSVPTSDFSGGAATADYDGDGRLDLFVTRYDLPPILYKNTGPGADGVVCFKDVTASARLEDPSQGGNGPLFADFDNDGDPDLFMTTVNHERYFLFINQGDGTFVEQAVARGVDQTRRDVPHFGASAAAGDYDGDGYLDLAIGEWSVKPSVPNVGFRLLRNLGATKPAHFVDVTTAAGIVPDTGYDPTQLRPLDNSLTPRFTDLDRDGLIDLAIASDYGTSRLFWNNGDGTFTDGTNNAAVSMGFNEMGSTIADYDGDGHLDWFLSSIHYGEADLPTQGNRLYRYEGDRTFSDRSTDAGIADAGWGWGASFFDYDNDTDFDLICTNGFWHTMDTRFHEDPTKLWRNNGEGGSATTFEDVSLGSGIKDKEAGKGLITFDYDQDGDLDVFITNNLGTPLLYRNDGGNEKSWLRIGLTGTKANRDAAGAFITVTDPRLKWPLIWEHSVGSNFLSQSEPFIHFGLGETINDHVELVTVQWPGGSVQEFRNVPVRQTLLVIEDEPGVTEDRQLVRNP